MKNKMQNAAIFFSNILFMAILLSVPNLAFAQIYNNDTYGEGVYNVGAQPPANTPGQFAPQDENEEESGEEPADEQQPGAPSENPDTPAGETPTLGDPSDEDSPQQNAEGGDERIENEEGDARDPMGETSNSDDPSSPAQSQPWYNPLSVKILLAVGTAAAVGGSFALLRPQKPL